MNAQTKSGMTPLHFACAADTVPCIELLVRAGADLSRGDDNRDTPLHVSARLGALRYATQLVEACC